MKISVFGAGYVGLVQAAVFADGGHSVLCVDPNADKIATLQQGRSPIFEPGLEALIQSGIANGLLHFSSDTVEAVHRADYLFICVGTPPAPDGALDLRYVEEVARSIGQHMQSRKVVITKSTVPVGTTARVSEIIGEQLSQRQDELAAQLSYATASNPEFLKEGSAVSDCQRPDRIILGTDSEGVVKELRRLYEPFNRNHDKVMVMDSRSAELTKYAANAMLATKISFMNEIAGIAEAVGADIENIRRGIGSDPRIGYQFIYPGCGYGGSCFPKDVRALQYLASNSGQNPGILSAVHQRNESQKVRLIEKLVARLGEDLSGHTIALWGLAFKPNTDDMRAAPSREVLEGIWARGGTVQVFDPQAMGSCKSLYGEREQLIYCDNKEQALSGADALVICTEWKAFWSPDFETIRDTLSTPLIFDGRNLYDPHYMAELGIDYYGIGRGLA